MYSKIAVEILLVLTVSTAVFAASVPKRANDEDQSGKEFTVLQKVYDDCESKPDFTDCLKGKALTAISRAVDQVIKLKFNKFYQVANFTSIRMLSH